MSSKLDPADDPGEAYAVIPTLAELRGPPVDWWTVTAHGGPVWYLPPSARDLAERFNQEGDQGPCRRPCEASRSP